MQVEVREQHPSDRCLVPQVDWPCVPKVGDRLMLKVELEELECLSGRLPTTGWRVVDVVWFAEVGMRGIPFTVTVYRAEVRVQREVVDGNPSP